MGDLRHYPEGRGAIQSRYIQNTFVEFNIGKRLRLRTTTAQINAGVTLLPALPGVKWQLLDWAMIALGGNAATATSIDILGTASAAAVHLAVTAIAALTRSALVRAGAANAVILADGASFAAMDVNTAITAITVGSALATATGIDLFIEYVAIAP